MGDKLNGTIEEDKLNGTIAEGKLNETKADFTQSTPQTHGNLGKHRICFIPIQRYAIIIEQF